MRAAAAWFGFTALVLAFWFGGIVAHFTPRPTTGYSRDLYAYFFPRYLYGAEAVWQGRIPLWNPHELCGVPFLASAQSGVFNPLAALVFGLAPAPMALHVYFLAHFLLTGALTYLFCRSAGGLGWQGAGLASVAWTLSPALTRSIYHPSRIACVAWLPLIFWLADRLIRRPDLARAALLALALAAQACAGYPELTLDTGLLLAVFLLVRLWTRDGDASAARIVAAFGATAVLGALLAGAQLAPTVELLGESARAAITARPTLVPGVDVLRTLFGLRRDVGFAYLGMLPALYVGALPLALAVCAAVAARSPLRGAFVACAVACVLAVVGYRYLHLLPVYRLTRFALPWALLLPFFTAVLAGAAWEGLTAGATRRGRIVAVLVAAGAGFVLLGTPVSLAWAVAGVALVIAAAANVGGRGALFALALLLVVGDLFVDLPYFRGTDPFPPLPRSATTRALLEEIDGRAAELRFLGAAEAYTGVALTERALAITGLEDSAMPRRLRRVVDHFNLGIAADMPLRLDAVVQSRPLLDLMGVAWVTGPARWAPALAAAGLAPVRAPADGADGLWRNAAALPRAFLVRRVRAVSGEDEAFRAVSAPEFRPREEVVLEQVLEPALAPGPLLPGDAARLLADTGEEVRVATSASEPALLVLADTYFPGWEAQVDGVEEPIERADFAFRAVRVPAGEHTVTFSYRPRVFRVGAGLSLAGLAIVAAALARARLRRGLQPVAASVVKSARRGAGRSTGRAT
jgi:hypothetical protein